MSEVDLTQLAVDRAATLPKDIGTRKNVLTRYILPAFLIIGFLTLIGWASRDLLLPPQEVRVTPVLATQAEVRAEGSALFNAAGWVEPRPTAIRVAALASGVVEALLVVEDQDVKAGEPVAQLVKDDAQLGYERAIADRELAEAELDQAKATLVAATTRFDQPVHLQAMLAQADGELAKINTSIKNLPFETQRAQSQVDFARRDYERNLSAGTSVSQREMDEAKTELETATALNRELQDRESSLKKEAVAIGQHREAVNIQLQLLADEIEAKDRAAAKVAAAQARVKQMTVAESEAALRLSRMTIKAPVEGRVYQLVGLPGARVGDGVMTAMAGHDGATIISMYQPESLQIRVDVRFEDIPKVSLLQPVRIDNPALEKPIIGSVLFISSEADIQKNTLQVKVGIEIPPDFFKPEMLVDVTFLAPKQNSSRSSEAKKEMRLYLPAQFIQQGEGGPFVWLADQSAGIVRRTSITQGATGNGGLVEIKAGLEMGSRVITSGADGLKDGSRIKITGED
ncbi:MAG: HlyD family efflux transporter periplasmic adaptor subunit [Mariniblastus sp.]|nr:HlyD family efflux transporter periplasmic adaptor subunit [Mariniblastus sp.]